jgi:hypothetical protein
MPLKAPAPAPAAISWTGWYIGLNAGYMWGQTRRPWASKPLPIDYEQCCSDQLNSHPESGHNDSAGSASSRSGEMAPQQLRFPRR